MDTNLNLLYRARTIDTFSSYLAKGATIKNSSGVSYTLDAPPSFVNWQGCVGNDMLYLQSVLMADNETKEEFANNSVIDLYALSDGSYQGSFYLPKHKNSRASNFRIFNETLIAVYKNEVIKYNLSALNNNLKLSTINPSL